MVHSKEELQVEENTVKNDVLMHEKEIIIIIYVV